MNRHFVALAFLGLSLSVLFLGGCSKLDTTTLGDDVIPVVDNINTFADTLDIEAYQGFFTDQDTVGVRNSDIHILGHIQNDPLFGKTTADLFLQLKPSFFPFYLGRPNDEPIELDSVVLCLNYSGFWGDSTQPISLQVREVAPAPGDVFWDTSYAYIPTSYGPQTGAALTPVQQIDIRDLKNYVKLSKGNDSINFQLRFKLDINSDFVQNLYNSDSALTAVRNGFASDSVFRLKFPGLAVLSSGGGNAIMYSSLTDGKTRLEIHYKKENADGVRDTIYTSLLLTQNLTGNIPSATANRIVRDRSAGTYPPAGLSDEIYLQGSPGTFANLKIPGLTGYPNRVIHRAQLEFTQVPGEEISDSLFSPPNYVYVDLKDTGNIERYKPLYFDLNPSLNYDPDKLSTPIFFPSTINFNYYGSFIRRKADPVSGRRLAYYNVNVTRYVQHIATHQRPNYTMRLSAPSQFRYPQLSAGYLPYNNPIGQGRVKIGGGTHPQYKMRMVIIYSNV